MNVVVRTVLITMLGATLVACEAEKLGDDCGGFFANGCKAPLSCVDMDDKKVCGGSCDWLTPDGQAPGYGCKDPKMKAVSVQYTKNGASVGGAGCYCLPQ